MQSLGYSQNHTLSDVRLGLGYAAVICCAAAAYYEYKVGFKEAKSWSIMGVGAYFALNAALYFWGYFIEGNTVYLGSKNGITVISPDPTFYAFLHPFHLMSFSIFLRRFVSTDGRWKYHHQ